MQFLIKDTSKLNYLSVDERIVLKLQNEGALFKKETYEHNYPHCWRTDKPILFYPLDSWFIKASSMKERMAELNKTINWKPESTGTGRFGEWLNNLQDWNLSRSRFWGIPLPIWKSDDHTEVVCVGSVEELKNEIDSSIKAGFMTKTHWKVLLLAFLQQKITLHLIYIVLVQTIFSLNETAKNCFANWI